MLTTNFSIDPDFIGIIYEGKYLDLHNNYDCLELKHNEGNRTAELSFKKGAGGWVPIDELSKFRIYFENVASIYTRDSSSSYPKDCIKQDNTVIDQMGFSYGDSEIMNGPTEYYSREDLPAILFVFVTGRAIKIIAAKASILVA